LVKDSVNLNGEVVETFCVCGSIRHGRGELEQ
jgi:hypothetical protein